VLVASALLAGAAGVAGAQGMAGRGALKQKFDLNKDGVLDQAERAKLKQAKQAVRKADAIAKFDANKDGSLDKGEKAVMRDQRASMRFGKLDTNHDGVLSLDEFKTRGGGHHRHGMGRKP
jgi:hypothetical protein